MKTTLTIQGTHCQSCKALIEDVARDIPGVKACSVDFKTGKTEIEYDTPATLAKVRKEIEGLGKYKVES